MFIVITLSWNAITCFLELSMRSFFVIRTSAFKSCGHFEECFYLKNFFKVSSNSCIDFIV